jgi:hypothetical protein
MERDLCDPCLCVSFRWVTELRFLKHGEKHLLYNFFRFTVIVQNPDRNGEDETKVAAEKNIERFGIVGVEASHRLFVTG